MKQIWDGITTRRHVILSGSSFDIWDPLATLMLFFMLILSYFSFVVLGMRDCTFCFRSNVSHDKQPGSHVSRPHAHKAYRGNKLTDMRTCFDLTTDRQLSELVAHHEAAVS